LPTVSAVPGIDLPVYANTILERFANKGVPYKTTQVACDGSQKLPQRLAAPALSLAEQGTISAPIAFVLAAWCQFLLAKDSQGQTFSVTDPMAEKLVGLAQQHVNDSQSQVTYILSESGVCEQRLLANQAFIGLVVTYVDAIKAVGVRAALKQVG
jgi:fructuronate reductase